MSKAITEIDYQDEELLENADFTYDLTPYHFNMDVSGLLRRFSENDILIPSFQRNYVWSKEGASMFIDSVLRGLPTPSLFFYEQTSRKYLVIDGQQRLLSLYYFVRGVFPDKKEHQNIKLSKENIDIDFSNIDAKYELKGIPFTLSGNNIFSPWNGKTFAQLTAEQQKRITDTYIYIINLKQTSPVNDNSSMYLVFERINTGSTPLNPQQIRLCVSHGEYAQFLTENAQNVMWGKKFNLDDKNSGVSELILRFVSLFYTQGSYKGSMKSFLDKELKNNDNFQLYKKDEIDNLYNKSFKVLSTVFDQKSFIQKKSLIGYFLLVTWISIANLVKEYDDISQFLNKFSNILKENFEKAKKTEEVQNFLNNTRRASNSETLMKMIEFMTNFFKDSIHE